MAKEKIDAKQAAKDVREKEKISEQAKKEQDKILEAGAKKHTAACTSACSKFDVVIASITKTLSDGCATLMTDSMKLPLENELRKLSLVHQSCGLAAKGLPTPIGGFSVPDAKEVKAMCDTVKKHEALFNVSLKISIQQARLTANL